MWRNSLCRGQRAVKSSSQLRDPSLTGKLLNSRPSSITALQLIFPSSSPLTPFCLPPSHLPSQIIPPGDVRRSRWRPEQLHDKVSEGLNGKGGRKCHRGCERCGGKTFSAFLFPPPPFLSTCDHVAAMSTSSVQRSSSEAAAIP